MIIIAGTVDLDPQQRAAALAAGRVHMEATRREEGCLDYVWSADPLVPGRVYVFERWESRDALAAHFGGPHYAAMLATMSAHDIRAVEVLKYRADRREPVYDSSGKPSADFVGGA